MGFLVSPKEKPAIVAAREQVLAKKPNSEEMA
jgi:hypothetical protein